MNKGAECALNGWRKSARRRAAHPGDGPTCANANTPKAFDRSAFTLMELVIVLGLLAVVASVVVPAMRPATTHSLEAVARVVAADLRLARSQAIQFNTDWTVRFDFDDNAYELVHTGAGAPPPLIDPLAPPGQTGYRIELDRVVPRSGGGRVRLAGAILKESGTPVDHVTFGPLGGTGPLRGDDTVLLLIAGGGGAQRTLRLTVSWITGRIEADVP